MLEKQGKRSGVKAGQWQRALLGGGAECGREVPADGPRVSATGRGCRGQVRRSVTKAKLLEGLEIGSRGLGK